MGFTQRISPPDFIADLMRHIANMTGIDAWGDGANHAPEFYYVELVGKESYDTKTFFQDRFLVNVHCIADIKRPVSPAQSTAMRSSAEAGLDMVGKLESALSNKLFFTNPAFKTALQNEIGYISGTIDPSGEAHCVVQFEFYVRYGMKCK